MDINLGPAIKKLRKQHQRSQADLAQELGLSRPSYIQIEKGVKELTISEVKKLAAIFGIPLKEFLGIDQKTKLMTQKSKRTPASPKIKISRGKTDKFKEILLYILEKIGAKPNVGKTVIYKLLYFIDFDFYEKYEEKLIGATYVKNHHGPTPTTFNDIVKEMEKDNEIEKVKSKYFQYNQKKYLPKRPPNLSQLNATEIKHIDEVLARLANKNANELSEYSHQDVPFITAENGEKLNYEAVFYRTNKTSVRKYDNQD